ncbi:hypothetical protein M378DRAFT_536196 [Amanita muscaria Koide BX008]|uniref:Uncharacterized protein n=1 Tax=Amanita muscaria (strain Koide BX008) TaxID=946122 RepID=A0A0C2X7I2_AMAMK|nr:hypothetical protein M378DRAFT_536196 [Amanita muscaria Koide BX008]
MRILGRPDAFKNSNPRRDCLTTGSVTLRTYRRILHLSSHSAIQGVVCKIDYFNFKGQMYICQEGITLSPRVRLVRVRILHTLSSQIYGSQ